MQSSPWTLRFGAWMGDRAVPLPGVVPASGAALLLNAEGVFTAAIASVVSRENVDRRSFIGMEAIVAGALVLVDADRKLTHLER